MAERPANRPVEGMSSGANEPRTRWSLRAVPNLYLRIVTFGTIMRCNFSFALLSPAGEESEVSVVPQ